MKIHLFDRFDSVLVEKILLLRVLVLKRFHDAAMVRMVSRLEFAKFIPSIPRREINEVLLADSESTCDIPFGKT
jgi:hypothetical protein